MKKIQKSFYIRLSGFLVTVILLLLGSYSCKSRQMQTKYGAPVIENEYDQHITKYGPPPEEEYLAPQLKYGAPVDIKENDL